MIVMAAGPIPFTAIDRYADRYGVCGTDAFDSFRELIRAMEDAFFAWQKGREGKAP